LGNLTIFLTFLRINCLAEVVIQRYSDP